MTYTCGASTFIVHLAIFARIIAADPIQGGQFAEVPNEEWTQVISSARDGWRILRQQSTPWRADVSVDNTYIEEGKQRSAPFQYSFNSGDDCGLEQTTTPKSHSEIYGSNRDYDFRLYRKEESPESAYRILFVGKDDDIRTRTTQHNLAGTYVGFADADKLVQSEKFAIHKMTRSDDQRFVVIVFSSNFELAKGFDEIVEDGTFTLDMSLHAAVTEYKIQTKKTAGLLWWHEGKTNYVTEQGLFYLESSSLKSGFRGADAHIIAVAKYANVRAADLDEADCRLSAFGFPEPGFSSQAPTDYWRTLLVLGNVAVGIIVFIVWRKSRKRSA